MPWTELLGLAANPFAPANEVTWARGRLANRTYISKSFSLDLRASSDFGQPARYVVKVFDEGRSTLSANTDNYVWEEWVVEETPGGRKQIKLQVAREAGNVRELIIQKVPTAANATKLEPALHLGRDGAARLIELIRALDYIPVDGATSVRLDDQTIRDVFADPDAMLSVYERDPERFRRLIESDVSAEDVVAVAHRRRVVEEFAGLLDDEEYFSSQAGVQGGPEAVWQKFLERNPWILGVTLAGQLLTGWDAERLEQVVRGHSVQGGGKRTDALLRTNGRIRAMVFAEIKTHRTALLGAKYREECWPPSVELSGGVVQIQQTVHLATREIGGRLEEQDEAGAESGEFTYLVRPRSFLIAGHLAQFRSPEGGVFRSKYESFELYRRNLYEPEIITFDELLARAEGHVALAEESASGG